MVGVVNHAVGYLEVEVGGEGAEFFAEEVRQVNHEGKVRDAGGHDQRLRGIQNHNHNNYHNNYHNDNNGSFNVQIQSFGFK